MASLHRVSIGYNFLRFCRPGGVEQLFVALFSTALTPFSTFQVCRSISGFSWSYGPLAGFKSSWHKNLTLPVRCFSFFSVSNFTLSLERGLFRRPKNVLRSSRDWIVSLRGLLWPCHRRYSVRPAAGSALSGAGGVVWGVARLAFGNLLFPQAVCQH